MPCGGAEVKGLDYCDLCVCKSKVCLRCNEEKDLGEFARTKVPHVLKLKSNLGRRFSCLRCQEEIQVDQKYYKLFEVSEKKVIDYNGRRVYFSHVEGTKAVCHEEDGTPLTLKTGVWVQVLDEEYYDDLDEILKESKMLKELNK